MCVSKKDWNASLQQSAPSPGVLGGGMSAALPPHQPSVLAPVPAALTLAGKREHTMAWGPSQVLKESQSTKVQSRMAHSTALPFICGEKT